MIMPVDNNIIDYASTIETMDMISREYTAECDSIATSLAKALGAEFAESEGWTVFFHGRYIEINKKVSGKPSTFINICIDDGNISFNRLFNAKVSVVLSAYCLAVVSTHTSKIDVDFTQCTDSAIAKIVYAARDIKGKLFDSDALNMFGNM